MTPISQERKDMNRSWRGGQPPVLRRFPMDDQRPAPAPLLTQPFEAGLTGWIVVTGAVIAELAGGAAVANQMSTAITVPRLIFPVACRGGIWLRCRAVVAGALVGR